MQKKHLQPHTRTYDAHLLTNKVFSNMKRLSKGYTGVEVPLFSSMLNAPSLSPEPSPSPQHKTTSAPSTYPPQHSQPSPAAEDHVPTPYDSPLHSVHSHGSNEGRLQQTELTALVTQLSNIIGVLEKDLQQIKKTYSTALTKVILKVKKLENQVKAGKARRRSRIIPSEDEDAVEDSSKQGRKISDIDEDPNIFLAQNEGVTSFQEGTDMQKDSQVQQKQSHDTEVFLEEEKANLALVKLWKTKKAMMEADRLLAERL
ncbi:hypothetical protein Tco_0281473 [Tanacetum coccineum]